jgi:hypothetical protein
LRLGATLLAVACIGIIGGTGGAAFASAGTITVPAANPYVAIYDATGANLSFVTVSGTGFPVSTLMFIEQCDGLAPSAPGWDATVDCDAGSSPAPVMSTAGGAVSFLATDLNRRFRPFEGASPQQNFNCLGPAQANPNNGLVNWTNCQIRVASSTSAATDDQAFKTITLPNPSAPAAPTAVKALSGSTTIATGPMTVTFTPGSIHGASVTNNTATCTSTNGGATKTGSSATSPITVAATTTAKTYTCKVSSTNAKGTSPVSLASGAVIEGTPAPPTGVIAKSGSTTTTTGPLVVTFVAGATNGSALTAPQYTATCTSSNGGVLKTVAGTTTSITVAGATTAKTYTCTVKEHNVRGTGLLSAASLPVIVGSPAAPTAVKAKSASTTLATGSLVVTFTAGANNGSALTAPQYTATCTSSNGGVTKTGTSATASVTVGAATTGKTYKCSVKEHNARGTGLVSALSLPVIVGTPAQPATPTVASGAAGTLNVTFTLLTGAQANGSPLTSPMYTATCTSSNGGVLGQVSADTSPIAVTPLTTGKTYTCTVAGNNARGTGLASAPSTAHVAP